MTVSTCRTVLDCTQRRQKMSAASTMPSASASRPSGRTGPISWSVIGPSISAFVTRGIAIERPTPASAVVSMMASAPRCGRR